jgi:ribosomal protein S18 acetylase RimI-like enzyme
MVDIKIRPATMDDYEPLCRLYRQADQVHVDLLPEVLQAFAGPARSREFVSQFVGQDDAACLVAEVDGEIVGMLTVKKAAAPPYPMFRPREHALVEILVVDEAHRHRGVGGALLDAAKQWARARGLKSLQTNVWAANTVAKRFYARHGFRTIAERIELTLEPRPPALPPASSRPASCDEADQAQVAALVGFEGGDSVVVTARPGGFLGLVER